MEYFSIWGNELCPSYPDCLDVEIIGYQRCIKYLGDVNGDELLNRLDLIIIANIILGSSKNVSEADVNLESIVNILDIVTLANMRLDR